MADFNATNVTMAGLPVADLSFAEFYSTAKPLLFFIVGVTIYSIFIFRFYKFFSRRDIFKLEESEAGPGFAGFIRFFARVSSHAMQNLVLIPILVFFWFAVLTILLIFLSKNETIARIMISSISIIGSVRITSFYNEELAQELAKLVPLVLLGVYIVEASYFSFEKSLSFVAELPMHWKEFIYYLVIVVGIEFVMRTMQFTFKFKTKELKE